MKAAQKPCIFLENAVCLLVPNETDNGACLTVTRFPQGHIAQKFRDLTKRSLFCVRSSFEPQAHDSLGISALSGSWESRLGDFQECLDNLSNPFFFQQSFSQVQVYTFWTDGPWHVNRNRRLPSHGLRGSTPALARCAS